MIKKDLRPFAALILLFLFLVLFFASINPIVVFDGDDWVFLSHVRSPFPKWGAWNPTKVLAEVSQPVAGSIAAFVIRPLVGGDYLFAVTLTTALILATLISAYFALFYLVARERMGLDALSAGLLVGVIGLLHFAIFRTAPYESWHMFQSPNMCSTYHYVVPNVVNACTVLYLYLTHDLRDFREFSPLKRAGIFLAVYLSLFSSVQSSIIIASYVSSRMIPPCIAMLRGKSSFAETLKANRAYLAILIIWFISLIFEVNGGRSNQIGNSIWSIPVLETATRLASTLIHVNKYFMLTIAVLAVTWIWAVTRSSAETRRELLAGPVFIAAVCLILNTAYTVLLCAKAAPGYVTRADCVFNIIFYGWFMLLALTATALRRYPMMQTLLVLIIAMLVAGPLNDLNSYRHGTTRNVPQDKALAVDRFIMDQIIQAADEGKTEMTLIVPKGDDRDNWPHPNYMGGELNKTLKAHGFIDHDMAITIKPDPEVNRRFGY